MPQYAEDWSGSAAARRARGPEHSGIATGGPPPPEVWQVAIGTPCLVKRAGAPKWRHYRTTQDLIFDTIHSKSNHRHIFRRGDWLIYVGNCYIQVTRPEPERLNVVVGTYGP